MRKVCKIKSTLFRFVSIYNLTNRCDSARRLDHLDSLTVTNDVQENVFNLLYSLVFSIHIYNILVYKPAAIESILSFVLVCWQKAVNTLLACYIISNDIEICMYEQNNPVVCGVVKCIKFKGKRQPFFLKKIPNTRFLLLIWLIQIESKSEEQRIKTVWKGFRTLLIIYVYEILYLFTYFNKARVIIQKCCRKSG